MIYINFYNFNFVTKNYLTWLPNRVRPDVKLLFNDELKENYINIIFSNSLEKWERENSDNFFVLYNNNNLKDKLKEINNKIDKYWDCCSLNGPIEPCFLNEFISQYKVIKQENKKIAIYIAGACTYYDIVFNKNINFYKDLEKHGYKLDFYICLSNKYYIKYYSEEIFGKNINGHIISKQDEEYPYIIFKDNNIEKFFMNHTYYKEKIKFLCIEDEINGPVISKLYLKTDKCISAIVENEIRENKYTLYLNMRPDNLFNEMKDADTNLNNYINILETQKDVCYTTNYKIFINEYVDITYPNIFFSNNLRYCIIFNSIYLDAEYSKRLVYYSMCNNCNTEYKNTSYKLDKCKICSNKLESEERRTDPYCENGITYYFNIHNINNFPFSGDFWSNQIKRKI